MLDYYGKTVDVLQSVLEPLAPLRISCTTRGPQVLLRAAGPVELPSHPWIGGFRQLERQLYIQLGEAFYREAMAHILEGSPGLEALSDARDPLEYAYMRLFMRTRQYGEGRGLDKGHMRALWLCMGTVEAGIEARVRAYRLREAAQAALELGMELSPPERTLYFKNTGLAAGCMARLLLAGKAMIKEDQNYGD